LPGEATESAASVKQDNISSQPGKSAEKKLDAIVTGQLTPDSLIDDYESLPRVADSIPLSAWLVALLTMAERFSFYGLSAPFQNFMQNPRDDRLRPGALGWGQARASQVSNIFYVLTQATPVFGAIVADKRLGRYGLLCVTFCI